MRIIGGWLGGSFALMFDQLPHMPWALAMLILFAGISVGWNLGARSARYLKGVR